MNNPLTYLKNYLSKAQLNYIVESRDWSIKADGLNIKNKVNNISVNLTTSPVGLRNTLIHFGSINTYHSFHSSNKAILTYFHHTPVGDEKIKLIHTALDLIHVTNDNMKSHLISLNIPDEKIIVIPLGIDTMLFKRLHFSVRMRLCQKYHVPVNSVVIGSFQKDGNGWGSGNTPKYVKAPEIFIEVVKGLQQSVPRPVFVLLTGPSRGYVKNELKKYNIPYAHYYPKFNEMPHFYNMIDLYLITSRSEGGPKALLEAMSCGIPVVSTKVGMSPYVIKDSINGYLTDIDDKNTLLEKSIEAINNAVKIGFNATRTVSHYSWENIADRYYNELYSKLINTKKL